MRYRFAIFRRLLERSGVPVFCCAASLSLLSLTGCASSGAKVLAPEKKNPDPILGDVHPSPAPPYAPAAPLSERPKQVPGNAANRPVDDPLFPSMPTSNAYLAGRTQRLPGSETLAISDVREPGAFKLTAGMGPPIVRPVPVDPTLQNNWNTQTRVNAGSSADNFAPTASNFIDPNLALLQSRGVTSQRSEPLADGTVRVTAIVPRRDDPTRQISYEAVGRDFAAAAQLIVQKIDQSR